MPPARRRRRRSRWRRSTGSSRDAGRVPVERDTLYQPAALAGGVVPCGSASSPTPTSPPSATASADWAWSTWTRCRPSCSRCLEVGEVDAAILPAFDVLAHPELIALPGTCIASDGPAMSVKLFSRIPLRFATTVALDTGFPHLRRADPHPPRRRRRAHPQYLNLPPDLDQMLAHADAALLIGDPCLRARPARDVLVDRPGRGLEGTHRPALRLRALGDARRDRLAALNALILRGAGDRPEQPRPPSPPRRPRRLGLPRRPSCLPARLTCAIIWMSPARAGLERFRQMARVSRSVGRCQTVRFALG